MRKQNYKRIGIMLSPLTSGGVVPTVTARCSNMGAANIFSVRHYPIPGVIEIYETRETIQDSDR